MKRFYVTLAAMLLTLSTAGLAQSPQPAGGGGSKPATTAAPANPDEGQAGPGKGAVQTSGAAATATPSAADPSRYIIGAEDSLQITVWKEPTLSGTFPVRPDGMISLVLAGDIHAAGLTPMKLADNITEKLKQCCIQDPSVSVVVMAVNSQRIFVIGEVGHVGPLMLTPGMSPLQAIAASGGLSPFAHSKGIYILRGEQGQQKKILFNYKQALKGDDKQLISLQPGDTIVVP